MSGSAPKTLTANEKKGFLGNNIYVILAFIIPAAIMTAVFAVLKYYPVGKGMVIVNDAWHQYFPFMMEYQSLLKEGSSVMYSWNTGGGSNFLGVIANYLGSPLYLITALLPSEVSWVVTFLAITVILRIGLAGMSFAIFLRKVFRRNDISLVTFSLMYAFCAYILGYYWNTMWLDTVALMPLVIAGTVGVLRDKKFSLYIISLAISVICSFYIGYMVCLFVLLFSIGYTLVTFVSFKESIKNAGKMALYTGIALMITAAVTVPAYMALGVSDSAADQSGLGSISVLNYAYGYTEQSLYNMFIAFARTITNMLAYTRPITIKDGLPNIACGVLALVLVFFYFTNKNIKRKERIISLAFCIFFLMSFVLNHINYIWHAFATPAMVYYRWSFIFSFAVLVLAYRAYTLIDKVTKKNVLFASVLIMVYLAAAFFLQIKMSVFVTFAGAFAVILGIVLYRKKKLSKKVFSVLLCLFVICEMGLSAYLGVSTVRSSKMEDYSMNKSEVEKFIDLSQQRNADELFRTEFLSAQTLNDGALNGAYGITTFNSMVNSNYSRVFEDLGLASSVENNRYEYMENTPVMNLLLNIKYIIARDGEEALSKYLKPVASTEECPFYENTMYVPSGFMTNPDILGYAPGEKWIQPLAVQNKMFSIMTGVDEDVFEFVEPVSEVNCEYMDKVAVYQDYDHCFDVNLKDVAQPATQATTKDETTETTKVSTEDEALLPMTVEYEIPEDGEYYGYFRSTTEQDGYITTSLDKDNPRRIQTQFANTLSLGSFKKGDKIEVVLNVMYAKKSRVAYYLGKLQEDVLAQGIEAISDNTMELTERTDLGLKGKINVKEAGLFFTSVLYDKGWKAYVDGKEIEITPFENTFIAFELSEGEHTIELEFESQGVGIGMWISVAGLVAFVILCIASKRKKPIADGESSESLETAEDAEPAQEAVQEDVQTEQKESCTDTDS